MDDEKQSRLKELKAKAYDLSMLMAQANEQLRMLRIEIAKLEGATPLVGLPGGAPKKKK